MVANAALFYGLVRSLADAAEPISSKLRFSAVRAALYSVARDGLRGSVTWADGAVRDARSLVLELLPFAAEGLDAWGVDASDRDRYLGIVADRCASHHTGAWWQRATTEKFESVGCDRGTALREMTRLYVEYARSGAPVHTWPTP
jgi:hypothetical protein